MSRMNGAVCGPYASEGRRVKVFQAERSLRTSGGLEIRDITEDVREAVPRAASPTGSRASTPRTRPAWCA